MGTMKRLTIAYSDGGEARFTHRSGVVFAVESYGEREEDAKAMWIVNMKPGFSHEPVEGKFDIRRVFDGNGRELGEIGPGARWFSDHEDAARYRDELGPDLARAFVLAPVLMLPVHIGESREGQDA